MFDELTKYKNHGHFLFEKGNLLTNVSSDVPNAPGVYYILKLYKGKIDLVYIGKSGTINQDGSFKDQMLRKRLNNKQDGMKRQAFFDLKLNNESIEALQIFWFVTLDEEHNDLPAYVEGLMIQSYFEINGILPRWNKSY